MEDDGQPKSEFEQSLLSRLNALKSTSKTLDRRKTSQSIQTGPPRSRTTDDVRPANASSRQPQSGGLSLQDELMKRRATLRGGEGGNSSGRGFGGSAGDKEAASSIIGGPADRGRRDPPGGPARLPTGKKKVPVPPSQKSIKPENELAPGKASWEPRRNKVSDIATKLNFQGQDSLANQGNGSSMGNQEPPSMPAAKLPKPKCLQKSNQSDVLQKFNNRTQPNDLQYKRVALNNPLKDQNDGLKEPGELLPPPPRYPPKQIDTQEANVAPSLPARGPTSNFKKRQNTVHNMEEKLEEAQIEAEAPAPLVPARMESFKKRKPAPAPPREDPRKKISNHPHRSSENLPGGGELHSAGLGQDTHNGNAREQRKIGVGRLPIGGSPRRPEKSITPVGSSSESDYSGDGRVRKYVYYLCVCVS